jgi:hypothetical protein
MLLDFFVKGSKSIAFRGDCAYQFRKSNRTAIGFSFMNTNSVASLIVPALQIFLTKGNEITT